MTIDGQVPGGPASIARQLLPQARSLVLALAVALVSLFYFFVAVLLLLQGKESLLPLAASALFALLAWGMWKMSRFVRWVTVICLWIMVVLVPLRLAAAIVYAVPFLLVGMALLYVLGRGKGEFRWP